jgi:hypothetical protein
MKRNKLLILIILILVMVLTALYLFDNKSGTFKDRENDFAVKDTASITKVFLADKKNRTILLERQPDGSWRLNTVYKARQSAINTLFETMKNITPKYPVPEKAHNTIVAQLAAQSVKVEVYQYAFRINLFSRVRLFPHEKLTKTYYVGGATADNMGTFMLMEGADVIFVTHMLGLRGFVTPRYSTLEKDWRDHAIFNTKLFHIQSITMDIPGDSQNSYRVVSENDQFSIYKLDDNEHVPEYDTLRLLNFLTGFSDIRYEALLDNLIDPVRKDSVISSPPKSIITLVDINNDSTSVKIYYKPNDEGAFDLEGNPYDYDIERLYASINEGRDFVLIQYYTFDKILRPLSFFIPNRRMAEF